MQTQPDTVCCHLQRFFLHSFPSGGRVPDAHQIWGAKHCSSFRQAGSTLHAPTPRAQFLHQPSAVPPFSTSFFCIPFFLSLALIGITAKEEACGFACQQPRQRDIHLAFQGTSKQNSPVLLRLYTITLRVCPLGYPIHSQFP